MIFDIERFSIHDGPGIRTTVFLKGCPLSCMWCHNPESQTPKQEIMFREHRCIRCGACLTACPEHVISQSDGLIITDMIKCTVCGDCVQVCQTEAREIIGHQVTVAEVITEIEKDIAFYDESGGGVTFSGGEPLMQPDFLLALLQGCKERDIHTAVDTSGLANWKTVQRIAEYVDLFLYDLKLIDDARHRQFTGISNELILANLRSLALPGRTIMVRVPIIPGLNDNPEDIAQLGQFVLSLAHRPPISILPYHKAGVNKYARLNKPYALPETQPPPDGRVAEIMTTLQELGLEVRTGG